jgi:8-oxo-dGTP diphosphatase
VACEITIRQPHRSATLARELREELGCTLKADFLVLLSASAANEPEHTVEAELFQAEIRGVIGSGADIEEALWVEPSNTDHLLLAPLTRDHVLPFVLARRSSQTLQITGMEQPT